MRTGLAEEKALPASDAARRLLDEAQGASRRPLSIRQTLMELVSCGTGFSSEATLFVDLLEGRHAVPLRQHATTDQDR